MIKSNHLGRALIKSILIFIFISTTITVIYFYISRQTDPFFYVDVSVAKSFGNFGHIQCPETLPERRCQDYIGHPMLIHSIASATGLTASIVQFLPIGLVLVPFIWLVLLKQFTESWLLPLLFTIPFAANPSYLIGHPSTNTYVWSRVLYFSVLLGFILYLKSSRIEDKKKSIAVVILLIFGMGNLYQSGMGWIFLNFFFASGLLLLIRDQRTPYVAIPAVLSGIILFSMPNTLLMATYIFILDRYDSIDGIYSFIHTIFELVGLVDIAETDYQSIEQSGVAAIAQVIWNAARLIRYPLLFGTVAILLLLYKERIYQQVISRENRLNWRTILIVTILATALFHTFVYISRGRVSLRYASITFPILILALSAEVDTWRWAHIAGSAFAIISFAALFGFIVSSGMTPVGADMTTDTGTNWIEKYYQDDEINALADFHTLGSMQVKTIGSDTNIEATYYNESRYFWVVEGNKTPPSTDLVIINTNSFNRDITSRGWQRYPPLQAYHSQPSDLGVKNQPEWESVYNDGKINIVIDK